MIRYTDSFGRETIVEILPSHYNGRLSMVTRKERQTIYESWEIDVARKFADELMKAIQMVEDDKDARKTMGSGEQR